MSKRLFDKKVKEVICRQMEELGGEISQEDVINIISPYIEAEIDVEKLKNSYKKQVANNLMARFRDDIGLRDCFVVQGDTGSKYVNLERTENVEDIKVINSSLKKKIDGLTASRWKADRRQQHLLGQISIDEIVK